jgi:hypothetical protein
MNGVAVMVGCGPIGANLVRLALLGTLPPSRVIPAQAGTQGYRYDRLHAQLAPRIREGRFWVPAFAGMTGVFQGRYGTRTMIVSAVL